MISSYLVGRSREVELGVGALKGVLAGRGTALALVGEAGIGKTRLATELSEQAAAMGLSVHWGRAWEAGGAPAYWPWRQMLESMQVAQPGSSEGPLSLLWGNRESGEFSSSDPAQARFELFDAVVRTLRELSRQKPLLCILEDLHAADVASVELATFAVGALSSGRVLFLSTFRDGAREQGPTADALSRLCRRSEVLALTPLSLQDTGELVKRSLPEAPASLSESLFRATSGNPLFLCETMRAVLLEVPSRIVDGSRPLPVAQGVALVTKDRVARLSPPARTLLDAGVALGREVDGALAAALVGSPYPTIAELAGELVSLGLWEPTAEGRWRFTHALVRDALDAATPVERRTELNLKIAHILDARVRAGQPELALARAHHALLALPRGDGAQIVDWVIAAAAQAREQRAFEEVVTLLERANRNLTVDDRLRAELLLALGWAYGDAGETEAAQRTFDEVLAVARRLSDARLLGRAVLGKGARYVLGAILTQLIEAIDEALAMLPESERALRARLIARKASAMTPWIAPDEPLALARQALEMIEGTADTRASLYVAVAAGSAFGDYAPPSERIPVNTRLVALARHERDRVLELRGLSRLVTDHLEAGDVAMADAVLLQRDALASSLGHARYRWMTPLFRSMRAMMEGRFEDCDRAFEEARALAIAAQDENASRCTVIHRFMILLMQDRLDDLRALEPEMIRWTEGVIGGFSPLIRSLVAGRRGQVAQARALLQQAGGPALPNLRSNNLLAIAAEAAVLCGDLEVARAAHALLERHSESNATIGLFGLVCGVPVRALLGSLAHALGRQEEAGEHFEAALERAASMGARAHETWVRLWYGQAVGSPAQLKRAVELARACGMPAVAARAEAAIEAVAPKPRESRQPEAAAVPFSLRPHEGGWRLECEAGTLVLKNLRGIEMLGRLLERPGQEIHCLDLVSPGASAEAPQDAGDAGELLDAQAKRAYRQRIEALSERIEDCDQRGDFAGAERARSELEVLGRELSRAVGLGGRARRASSAAERARVTAQRRLRDAIKKIRELDADVGSYLERTVRTGTFCAFDPQRRSRA